MHQCHLKLYHLRLAGQRFARAQAGGLVDLLTNYSELTKEILMFDTLHEPDRRQPAWRDANANRGWKSPARSPRRARSTIGFWVGGVLLGTGGCILGMCMPYHHPVAVVLSALWWGIYLGCFGASVGALIALFTERAPAACSVPQEERVGHPEGESAPLAQVNAIRVAASPQER
jgi:hypothetical protein